jgi:thymidine phosphorylase
MRAIVEAQGARDTMPEVGHLLATVDADEDGHVVAIDNQQIARIARLAGAPMDKGAGVDLFRKVGDPVSRGEPLYGIHAKFGADFEFATDAAAQANGFTLGARNPTHPT